MTSFTDTLFIGLAGAFFFALVSLARCAVSAGFLERPLVIGFFAALALGRWELLLPLAVFHELFWLDVIPVGTVVPPSPSLSFLLLAGVIQVFEITTPGALILPLMGTVLCAYLPCRLEQAGRLRTDAVVERVEHALIDPACDVDALLKREIRTSLLSQTLRAAALYLLCFAGLCLALCSVRNMYDGLPDFVAVTAPVLLCAGSLGALLALRTRRAFAVFVLAVWLVLLAHRV